VPFYVPAFAGTHCAYPRRDGQAELTWVAGCIPRWFTHPQHGWRWLSLLPSAERKMNSNLRATKFKRSSCLELWYVCWRQTASQTVRWRVGAWYAAVSLAHANRVHDFLSVINRNLGAISHRFWYTATYWLKSQVFLTPSHLASLLVVILFEFIEKLQGFENYSFLSSWHWGFDDFNLHRFWLIHLSVERMDRRTDEQTNRLTMANTRCICCRA